MGQGLAQRAVPVRLGQEIQALPRQARLIPADAREAGALASASASSLRSPTISHAPAGAARITLAMPAAGRSCTIAAKARWRQRRLFDRRPPIAQETRLQGGGERHARDGHGRVPAGPELLEFRRLLAPSQLAQRLLLARLLRPHRPGARSRQVPAGLLRRPARDAGVPRRAFRRGGRARHPLRQDGSDRLPHADGDEHHAARPRLDLLDDLLPSLPRGAAVPDARPDDARARRLERRHLDERRRGAEYGAGGGRRARRAL